MIVSLLAKLVTVELIAGVETSDPAKIRFIHAFLFSDIYLLFDFNSKKLKHSLLHTPDKMGR